VQLGGDEVEPFHQPVTRQAPRRRGEPLFRHTVGQILDDGRALGEHLAVVERQCRDVAQGIDGLVITPGFGLAGLEIDPFELKIETALAQHDMG
jgi:hypothetical protein